MEKKTKIRPSWDEYFMDITKLTAKRSNCIRRDVGCVLVKNNRIISTGYNGTAAGLKNCTDGGCFRCFEKQMGGKLSSGGNLDLCLCLHAEENALLFSSKDDMNGSTLYCTNFPCLGCAKKIVQCGIKRIVYLEDYCDKTKSLTNEIIELSGIECKKYI